IGAAVGVTGNWGELTLGSNASTQSGAVKLVLNYVLVLGFLFMGIFLARSLSNALALRIASIGTALPFTLGSRFLVGPLGRALVGGPAYGWQKKYAKAGADALKEAANAKDEKTAARYTRMAERNFRAADRFGKLAGKGYNPAD